MSLPEAPLSFDVSLLPSIVEQEVVWSNVNGKLFLFPNTSLDGAIDRWNDMKFTAGDGPPNPSDPRILQKQRLYQVATDKAAPWNKNQQPFFQNIVAGDSGQVLGRVLVLPESTTSSDFTKQASKIALESGYYENLLKIGMNTIWPLGPASNDELQVVEVLENVSWNVKETFLVFPKLSVGDKWKQNAVVVSPAMATWVVVRDLDNNKRTLLVSLLVTCKEFMEKCKSWYSESTKFDLSLVDFQTKDANGKTVILSHEKSGLPFCWSIGSSPLHTSFNRHNHDVFMFIQGTDTSEFGKPKPIGGGLQFREMGETEDVIEYWRRHAYEIDGSTEMFPDVFSPDFTDEQMEPVQGDLVTRAGALVARNVVEFSAEAHDPSEDQQMHLDVRPKKGGGCNIVFSQET